MKFVNSLIVVSDMERSKVFYKQILEADVILDFGANVTLTGNICLQTKESWKAFIGANDSDIRFGGNNAELYFEEDDFDNFCEKLKAEPDIVFVHPVVEHSWGQRVVRFYDPDMNIIEVGENIKTVCRRFADKGMSVEEIAKRMDIPVDYVNDCLS